MRVRRLHKKPAELEVTGFIDLIAVLVPFLRSTAVFTRPSVLERSLPAAAAPGVEALKAETLQLEIVIRPNAPGVGDKVGGLIQRNPDTAKGRDAHELFPENAVGGAPAGASAPRPNCRNVPHATSPACRARSCSS